MYCSVDEIKNILNTVALCIQTEVERRKDIRYVNRSSTSPTQFYTQKNKEVERFYFIS